MVDNTNGFQQMLNKFYDSDAEYIETPEGNSYVFEITIGMRELDIKVTEDGAITELFDR